MKRLTVIFSVVTLVSIMAYSTGCKPSALVASKSGAQIWGENCLRCHNAASPETFSDIEWEVAGMHMQLRANLTQDEAKKVIAFLQSAN